MKTLNLLAALCCAFLMQSAIAADYVAVKVEAENYSQKNSLWRLFTNSSRPNIKPDPDGPHLGGASGRGYLELLPDTRVTHSDALRTGTNFWPAGGQGPAVSYNVNFPEAGRYTVWVKTYSTGTEDNGIHVGINNTNPASGERIQWCSGKNSWTWSSAQRTNSNHCGVARAITLNVPFAGANTITFTAREDGFEFDQFMLIKENRAGLSCAPNGNDSVSCNRGASGNTTTNNTPAPAPAPTPAPTPEPEPVPAPAPEPVVQVQSAPADAVCSSASSDPDGDGWGWENGQSCRVASGATSSTDDSADNGIAVCVSSLSDDDGDGWGWENNQTCVIDGSAAMQAVSDATTPTSTPACSSSASDSDGDGWGWENNQSCVVR